MTRRLLRPNLFIVGAAKAGTTSLHCFLAEHPEIFMHKSKEPNHFCTDLQRESDAFHGKQKYLPNRSRLHYLKSFHRRKDERIIGESSVSYLVSKEAAANIRRFNPDAKIIIMLREPVELMRSVHSAALVQASETEKDFGKAVALEKERENGSRIPKTAATPTGMLYKKRVRHSEQIRRFLDEFPPSQVKVVLLDDLKERPAETYRQVLEFLGVEDKDFEPRFDVKNTAVTVRSVRVQRWLKEPDLWLNRLLKMILPYKVKRHWYSRLKHLNRRKGKEGIAPGVRRELMEELKPEVERLDRLLHENGLLAEDKDLVRLWGYDRLK